MEKKIIEINNIYKNSLDIIDKICDFLSFKQLSYKLGFYNNHEIKIKNKFIKEIYPIPVVSFKINKSEIDIGIDVVNDDSYIGFIEFTLSKSDILSFNFDKLKDYIFEVYGVENYLEDYYFGNVENMK